MIRQQSARVALASGLALSLICTTPTIVVGQGTPSEQQEFADPGKEQLSLNDDAVRAIIQEDYARAVALLEEANALGELNVTYLNLGRAYQMLGNCDKARGALDAALEAPKVQKPSPAFIEQKVDQYRGELDEQCARQEEPPQRAAAGEDDTASASAESEDETPESPDATASAEPNSPPEQPLADEPSVEEPAAAAGDARADSGPDIIGWTVTATGVAAIAAGGTMFLLAESERDAVRSQPEDDVVTARTQREAQNIESRANTYDTIGVAAAAAGVAVTGAGIYLLLADDSESSAPSVSVGVQPDAASVQWRLRF